MQPELEEGVGFVLLVGLDGRCDGGSHGHLGGHGLLGHRRGHAVGLDVGLGGQLRVLAELRLGLVEAHDEVGDRGGLLRVGQGAAARRQVADALRGPRAGPDHADLPWVWSTR